MTNPFQQFNWEAHFLEKRGRNASVAIQLPFFGKRFLAAARRSRTISRSSLPSQNSITQLGQGNQMFHLETQWAAAPTAHVFQFRALLLGHADVESECFSLPLLKAARAQKFELMAKKD